MTLWCVFFENEKCFVLSFINGDRLLSMRQYRSPWLSDILMTTHTTSAVIAGTVWMAVISVYITMWKIEFFRGFSLFFTNISLWMPDSLKDMRQIEWNPFWREELTAINISSSSLVPSDSSKEHAHSWEGIIYVILEINFRKSEFLRDATAIELKMNVMTSRRKKLEMIRNVNPFWL